MLRPNRESRMTLGRKTSFWGLYDIPWSTFVIYERITTKLNRDTVESMVYECGTFVISQSYNDKILSLYGYRGFYVRGARLPYHDKILIVIRPRPCVNLVGKGIDNYGYRITTTLLKRGTLRAFFSRGFNSGVVIYNDKCTANFALNKPSRDTWLRGSPRLSYHGKLCSYHDKSYNGKPNGGVTARGNCLVCSEVLAGWCS